MRRLRPRERNLPLAGENDDDRKNHEPEQEQLRRDRRLALDCLSYTAHRLLSVPTRSRVVKLQNG